MTIDLRLHAEKKRASDLNDMLLKEVMRDPSAAPIDVQTVRLRGKILDEIIEAKYRGDDISRIARAINMLAADMVVEFVMMVVPPTNPTMVVQLVNTQFKEMSEFAGGLVEGYLQPPPQQPANDG